MMLRNCFFVAAGLFFAVACDSSSSADKPGQYVLAIQTTGEAQQQKFAVLLPDTVTAKSPLQAYQMAVQRFAAGLLETHRQGEKNKVVQLAGISITNAQGEEVGQSISQEKRDSVLMDFIKFARESSIPYREHVKDFELKMMTIR